MLAEGESIKDMDRDTYFGGEVVGTQGISARVIGWWAMFAICLFYSAFAFVMAGMEIAFRLGMADAAPQRAVPIVFIFHAAAGGIVLICGVLQFNRYMLVKRRRWHRALGLVYVVTIWISSIAGLWSALFFNVTGAAKVAFVALAVLWFASTTLAYRFARARHIAAHRTWMIRSFALSLFFVTFSLWEPALEALPIPASLGYPLAVCLGWGLNLIVAERWIRSQRRSRSRPGS